MFEGDTELFVHFGPEGLLPLTSAARRLRQHTFWIGPGEKWFGLLKETSQIPSHLTSLIEFCGKSPRDQMLRKCFLPEEGHLLPHVDGGHGKLDSLQPQDHEEPLAEGAVAHVLTVVSSLKKGQRIIERRPPSQTNVQPVRQ